MTDDARLGLGVGLDLPWKGPYGIVGNRVSTRTLAFLRRYAERFHYLFVSWQPPHRGTPRLEDVVEPLDDLFANVEFGVRALHQTALNLAGSSYARAAIITLTNQLAARYGFSWVNEDLGSWSVRGRPLPYPQPPPMTDEGIAWCARTCADVARELDVPLVVEFPGFETPAPWLHGDLDAYDVFRRVVDGANVQCNLDTGHLLTWRYLAGHRGEALLGDLDRLPLDRCLEIHCAGTVLSRDRIVDAHHGVLLDLQLELASRLMACCPNLRVVTWEDPRFDRNGVLPPALLASLDALDTRTRAWMAAPPAPGRVMTIGAPELGAARETADATAWEAELDHEFVARTDFGRRCRAQVLSRSGLGVGRIVDVYPEAIAAWCGTHGGPDDPVDALLIAFLDSASGRAWSDFAWAVPGLCIEDAFGRFVAPGSAEHLGACARVLAVHREPPFEIPAAFCRAPRGWFAIGGREPEPLVLYAAIDGKLITGPITPLIRDLLLGGARPAESDVARHRLVELGLVAPDESLATAPR